MQKCAWRFKGWAILLWVAVFCGLTFVVHSASFASNLFDIFTSYMGLTGSVDRAEFAETVLGWDDGPTISPHGGGDFCVDIEVGGFVLAKATGLLYDNGSLGSALEGFGFGCHVSGLANLFSGFVCTYENILSDVFGDAICSFQVMMETPIQVFATIYVAFVGVMFATGIMVFTRGEAVTSLLKVALVVGLTANTDFTVYVLYRGVMLFVQSGTNAVLSSINLVGIQDIINAVNELMQQVLSVMGMSTAGGILGGLSGFGGILQTMDSFINDFLTVNVEAADNPNCGGGILSMTLGLLTSVPLLGVMGLVLFMMLGGLLIRVMFSFLESLTGIMFLVTLAPLFISFAMFRFTEKTFANWVKYLVGYGVRIVLIFAFVGFASSLGLNMLFKQLYAVPGPYEKVNWYDAYRYTIKGCTPCSNTESQSSTVQFGVNLPIGVKCVDGEKGVAPENLSSDLGSDDPMAWLGFGKGFIDFATEKMVLMLVITKLLSGLLSQAPEIASAVASVDFGDGKMAVGSLGKLASKSKKPSAQKTSKTGANQQSGAG